MLNIKSCFDLVKRILSVQGACQGVTYIFFLRPEYDPTTVDCISKVLFPETLSVRVQGKQQRWESPRECCQLSHDANEVSAGLSAVEKRNRILLPSTLRLASKTKMAANLPTIDLNLIW